MLVDLICKDPRENDKGLKNMSIVVVDLKH